MNTSTKLSDLIPVVKDKHLERLLVREKPLLFELIFVDEKQHPLPHQPLHFEFLGNGANKTVFGVTVDGHKTPTEWVLCVQNSMISSSKKEFIGEIGILAAIAKKGLRVPGPFEGPLPDDFIFEVHLSNDEDSRKVDGSAFFMERLDIGGRFIEMQKRDKPEDFMLKCLKEAPDAHKHVATTIASVKAIRNVFDADPWADFQVLYDKANGELMVFDPWPDKNGIKKEVVMKMLDKWEKDLEEAAKGH